MFIILRLLVRENDIALSLFRLYLISNKIVDDSNVSELTQLLSDSSLELHNDKYPAICDCFNRIKRDKEAISEMCKVMEDYAIEKVNENTITMIKNAIHNGCDALRNTHIRQTAAILKSVVSN